MRILVGLALLSLLAVASLVILRNVPEATVGRDHESEPWQITLAELGHSHMDVPILGRLDRSSPISVPLPEGSTQGPDDWWLLYGHFTVEFAPDSGPGIIWISAATNGRIAIQLKIETPPYSNGFMTSQLELLNGSSKQFTLAPTQTYGIANFVQLSGIHSGQNELVFQLRQSGDVRVRRLVVHEDTAMIRLPLSPPKLQMEAAFPKKALVVGSQFPLDLHLTSDGWPVKDLSVEIKDSNDAFQVEGESRRTIERLFGSHVLSYRITSLKSGTHRLALRTHTGNAGNPQATFEITAYRPGDVPPMYWLHPWQWGMIAGFLVTGGIFLLWKYWDSLTTLDFRTKRFEVVIAVVILSALVSYSFGLEALGESALAIHVPGPAWYALGSAFLIVAFMVGILFRSDWWAAIPILGYFSGMFLWYLVTGTSPGEITYDLSLLGFALIRIGVPLLLMFLIFRMGRALHHSNWNQHPGNDE